MAHKLIHNFFITITIAIMNAFPLVINAATSTSTTQPPSASPATPTTAPATEMSKDDWLNSMMPMLPNLICKGFVQDAELKKRFENVKMTYDKCVLLIPDNVKKCRDQIYADIPQKITNQSAAVWGKTLGECIGKDFAEKHLIQK